MKNIYSIVFFVLGINTLIAQIDNPEEKFTLPSELSESSGAIFFNDKLITHNDSGGNTKLFELDTVSGLVTREVTISNATNVDWEDITQDATSIYIGDIGNNVSGNRTDLKVYKISKSDYLNNTSVTAETIAYSYADQTDFTAQSTNNTEWDAEALVSFDANTLMVFTKNWVDGITKVYALSKSPGSYSISPNTTTLNSGGLITGGTYNPSTGKLYLVGYNETLQPFVWVSESFSGNDVFSGTNTNTTMPSLGFEQTEAITFVDEQRYFITSEAFSQGPFSEDGKLISFSTNDTTLSLETDIIKKALVVYPNPVNDFLNIEGNGINSIEIFDTKLKRLFYGNTTSIDVQSFSHGLYLVKINFNNGFPVIKKFIKN